MLTALLTRRAISTSPSQVRFELAVEVIMLIFFGVVATVVGSWMWFLPVISAIGAVATVRVWHLQRR